MNNHDDYFVQDILPKITELSKVERKKVGAVIGSDLNFVHGQGFNSNVREKNRVQNWEDFQIHAEAEAISFAARNGFKTEGCTLYCTIPPCPVCASMIIKAGIKRVVYLEDYWSAQNLHLLTDAGIEVIKYDL